jgi:hypothetical protein
MTRTFSEEVRHVLPLFTNLVTNPALVAFFVDSERIEEATRVNACVERAVAGECEPSGRLAISRYTVSQPPALGAFLVRKGRYDPANCEHWTVVGGAARKVLAVGWLFACTPKAAFRPERSETDVWAVWAPSVREPLRNVITPEMARMIERRGAELLVADMTSAGLTRRFAVGKVHQIGGFLARAGYFLRMAQTEQLPDDVFALGVADQALWDRELPPGRWAWDAYPAAA